MKTHHFPRVLQVIPTFQASGGVERGTLDIAMALLDKTEKAFVLSSGGDMVELFESLGGTHLEMPVHKKNPFHMIQNIGKIQRVLCDFKIDVVHARSRAPAWSTYVAARALNIPFVTTYHAPYSATNAIKRLYNSVMARGDSVIAISSFIKDHIFKEYGHLEWFDPAKIQVVHRGIDMDFFHPQHVNLDKQKALRDGLKLPDQARLLLLPGRLTRWKGQLFLLEAFAKLQHKFPDVFLVFAGNPQGRDGYVQELEHQAEQFNLSSNIRLLPHVHDLPALYHLSYAAVSPSLEPEGFGRVMAEAGAMERPIIAANHGGAKEIVLNEETGFVFQPGSVQSLVTALERTLNLDTQSYQQMGKAARARIQAHFSQQQFCKNTLEIYHKLYETKRIQDANV